MNVLMKMWQRKGPKTAAAGTAIVLFLDAVSSGRTVINRLSVLVGATAHKLSVMQVLGKDKIRAAAAAAQAVVKIAEANALGIATGDYCAVEMFDGTFHVGTVTVGVAADGLKPITFASNLPKAVAENARLLWFDLPATHEQVDLAANGRTTFEAEYGYFGANERGEPLLLHIDNATNASVLESVICPIIDA